MGGLRNCSLGLNIRKLARANDGSWLCYAGYLLRLNCERIFTDVAIPSESWIGCRSLVYCLLFTVYSKLARAGSWRPDNPEAPDGPDIPEGWRSTLDLMDFSCLMQLYKYISSRSDTTNSTLYTLIFKLSHRLSGQTKLFFFSV